MNLLIRRAGLLLTLSFAGCASYSARIEMRSPEVTTLRESVSSVKSAVSASLAKLGFSAASEKALSAQKQYYPDVVALWGKAKDFGFWSGEKSTSVWLHVQSDLILLIVNSKDGGDKEEVARVREELKQMLEREFPRLQLRVEAWTYLNTA
jgi:hypothetical protein